MKSQITTAIMLLLSFVSFSQIKYEKGYFISNDGTKTECLIKNIEWRYNPTEFLYKLSENDISKIAKISAVKEFEIIGESKYIRHTVKIDFSTTIVNNMKKDRNPKWENKIVFLKILVEGETNLYQYLVGNNFKYFFNTITDSQVKQLVFKEYLTRNGTVAKNLTYINQLYQKVNCNNLTIDKIKSVSYNLISLTKYFKGNNTCNPNLIGKNKYKKKGLFNLKLTSGVNYSNLKTESIENNDNTIYNFGYDISLRLGIETEFIFTFNKNKWSVFIEPNYYSYTSNYKKETNTQFQNINTEINASAKIKRFAFPIGIRYYMFINDNTKAFINLGFGVDIDVNSSLIFKTNEDKNLELSFGTFATFFGGIGININNKYSAEIRYFSSNHLGEEYLAWDATLSTTSFVLGYNFL